ncbi:MAG: S8 family serine peptidase [Lachnospiraceae bacterium]|nr:S8 family serine peptidase [Lachnospiraceae bacterium]
MLKKFISITLSAFLLFLTLAEAAPFSSHAAIFDSFTFSSEEEGTHIEGQVIVTLAAPSKTSLAKKGTTSFDDEIQVETSWNFGNADTLGNTEEEKEFLEDKTMYVSKVSSDIYSTEELIEKLKKKAYVVSVEPDYYQKKMSVTNDTLSDFQWYLDGTGKFSGSGKGIQYSKGKNISSSKTPIVAVVDTGIDYTHEDLSARMWKNPYSSLPGVYGYDYGDYDSDPMDEDEDGHGTHCAGSIGAISNNGKGIAGVSNNVRLMALKVVDSSGDISNSSIIGAFNYIYRAQKLGANIAAINCSWGGGGSSETMKELVKKIGSAGALFIFAAGNDGKNRDATFSSRKECPYDLPDTYTVKVGASTPNDLPASFSDYGISSVDLFAPGSDIVSTVNRTEFFPSFYTREEQKALCAYYSSCGDEETALYTPTDIGIQSPDTEYMGISHSAEDYFGNISDGSLQIFIRAPYGTSSFFVYMDVTDLNLDASKTHYVSCDIGLSEKGEISWEHYSRKISSSYFITQSGKRYVRLLGLSGPLYSQAAIYIDNPAISVDNPDTTRFGKYSIMGGSSMSAPIVSGAVAVMASHFTTDTATKRKSRLLSCTRKLSSLSLHCKTSGLLDMSKIASSTVPESKQKILVKKVKLNRKKATLRYKKKLKLKATITPKNATNKKVKWYSSKKKYATVTKNGIVKAKKKGIGHTVKIYARAKDGSKKKAYCKVKIKKKR